jgi:hypothetical protein
MKMPKKWQKEGQPEGMKKKVAVLKMQQKNKRVNEKKTGMPRMM